MGHSGRMAQPAVIHRDQDRFTGEHCTPEKRTAILEGVRNGTPVLEIARTVQCAPATVQVIRDQALPDWKQEQSNGLKKLARAMVNHFNDADLNAIPWTVKPVMLGIVMDKIAQLDGEPQMVVEHRHSVDLSSLRTSLTAPQELDVTPVHGIGTASPSNTPSIT